VTSGWKEERLGEGCSFLHRGIAPKYLDEGGICVLNQKCVRDHRVSFVPSRRHDPQARRVGSDRLVRAGDVLINSTGTGTLGRVAQVREDPSEPTTVDSHVTIARPQPGKFDPDFFGYMLIVIERAIKEAGEGCGGQTELARGVLAERFSVSYPESVAEQQRIVSILDTALSGVAAAKASAAGNLRNVDALLASHLDALFANREGWTDSSVGELASEGLLLKPFDGNHGEIHPRKADYTESGVAFIMAADLRHGEVDTERCKFISRGQADSLRVGFAKNGDVLISHKGTIGRTAVISSDADYVMLTPQVTAYRILDTDRLFNRYLRYYFMSPIFQREIVLAAGGGSTRAYIGITKQLGLRIRYPSIQRQREIAVTLDSLCEGVRDLEAIYQRKAVAVDELAQSLLHQAFSGELGAHGA
jgi:type I restriction enzyme, S subunit